MKKMTLSEVFYEAACVMSEDETNWHEYSCHAVLYVSRGHSYTGNFSNSEMDAYSALMTEDPNLVERAANKVRWPVRDFRTFMLLMASEAVK